MILQMLIQGKLVFTFEFSSSIWVYQPYYLRNIHELLPNNFDKLFLVVFNYQCTLLRYSLLFSAYNLVTLPVKLLAFYSAVSHVFAL